MADNTQSEKPKIQTEGRIAPHERPQSNASRFPSVRRIIVLLLIISVASGGTWYWRYSSIRESTDDAQIDGHLHPVSARISGTVLEVLVRDNQYVEQGTPVVKIDPSDYQVAVDRARADLAEMEATLHVRRTEVPITSITTFSQLSGAEASVGQAEASVAASLRVSDLAPDRAVCADSIHLYPRNSRGLSWNTSRKE